MDPIELMQGYIQKLKAAQKALTQLEKQAQQLAEQEQEYTERVRSIQAEIAQVEGKVAELEAERKELMAEYQRAEFEDDLQQQREIKRRRSTIDREVESHRQTIHGLHAELEALEQVGERAAVEVAIGLDRVSVPDVFTFVRELETALHKNTMQLKTRVQQAKSALPRFEQDLYAEVRSEVDEDYARAQERQRKEYEQTQARLAEQAEKDRLFYENRWGRQGAYVTHNG